MAKRRTRKQKIKAKRPFVLNRNGSKKVKSDAPKKTDRNFPVKGQIKKGLKHKKKREFKAKSADNMAKDTKTASVKKDLLKSLIIASLILSLEVVIYLGWK